MFSRLENVAQVPSTVLEKKDKTGHYTISLLACALERHAALLHMLLKHISTVSAMPNASAQTWSRTPALTWQVISVRFMPKLESTCRSTLPCNI